MKKLISVLLIAFIFHFNCSAQCNVYIKFYNYSNVDNVYNLIKGPGNTFFCVVDYYDAFSQFNNKAIAQLDVNGDTLWLKSFCGTTIKELFYSSDSNLVSLNLTGEICGDTTLGLNGLKLSKYNQNGDTIWNSFFGSTGINWAEALVVLNDSSYIVASDNDFAINNLHHLDKYGTVINTGSIPFTYIKDAVQGKDGNVYFCGYAGSGFLNSFVIGKSNSTLDTIFWIKGFGTSGGNYGDWFNAMYALPDSNIIVTGRDGTYKINYLTGDSIWKNNLGYRDIWALKDSTLILNGGNWLYKININGDSLWSKYLNMNANHWLEINSIIELDQGCFAVLGARVTSFATTTYEPFFAYFDSVFNFPINVGLAEQQVGLNATIYPIPFTNELNIKVAENMSINSITITTVTGQVVKQFKPSNVSSAINITDLSSLSSGIYFLKLDGNDKTSFVKIVKL